MKKRVIAVCLALALVLCLLSGCGSTEVSEESSEETAQASDESEAAEAETDTSLPDEAVEDVVYYLTDGLLNADDIVYTIDGVDISAAYYLYWITYEAYLYSQVYYNSYYVYPEITQEFSDGTSMVDVVTASANTYMLAYAVTYAQAVSAGIELSGDYLEDYETYYEESVYDLGEEVWDTAVSYGYISEDDYSDDEKEELIEAYGEYQMMLYLMYYSTTAGGIDDLYLFTNYFYQYRDDLYLEGGEYEISDDAIEEYIEEYDIYACRYIFFGNATTTDITDDEFAEYEEAAQACYDELSSLSGDALDEKVAEYAAENADGNTTGEVCFSSSAEIVEGITDVLETLDVGELGITAQTENGYYVMVRDEVTRDTIITELEYSIEISVAEAEFEVLVDEWVDAAEVTDYGLLDDFDIYTFYENLEALRDIIDEVD